MKRWFWVGARDDVRAGLEQLLDCAASEASLAAATADDLVIVDALAGPPVTAALGGRHAFAGVRWLKAEGRQVYVVVDAEDEIGAQLARFCLANGSLRWHAASRSIDGSELLESRGTAPRPSVRPSNWPRPIRCATSPSPRPSPAAATSSSAPWSRAPRGRPT